MSLYLKSKGILGNLVTSNLILELNLESLQSSCDNLVNTLSDLILSQCAKSRVNYIFLFLVNFSNQLTINSN